MIQESTLYIQRQTEVRNRHSIYFSIFAFMKISIEWSFENTDIMIIIIQHH